MAPTKTALKCIAPHQKHPCTAKRRATALRMNCRLAFIYKVERTSRRRAPPPWPMALFFADILHQNVFLLEAAKDRKGLVSSQIIGVCRMLVASAALLGFVGTTLFWTWEKYALAFPCARMISPSISYHFLSCHPPKLSLISGPSYSRRGISVLVKLPL